MLNGTEFELTQGVKKTLQKSTTLNKELPLPNNFGAKSWN